LSMGAAEIAETETSTSGAAETARAGT
jgi:hypothetical protein